MASVRVARLLGVALPGVAVFASVLSVAGDSSLAALVASASLALDAVVAELRGARAPRGAVPLLLLLDDSHLRFLLQVSVTDLGEAGPADATAGVTVGREGGLEALLLLLDIKLLLLLLVLQVIAGDHLVLVARARVSATSGAPAVGEAAPAVEAGGEVNAVAASGARAGARA